MLLGTGAAGRSTIDWSLIGLLLVVLVVFVFVLVLVLVLLFSLAGIDFHFGSVFEAESTDADYFFAWFQAGQYLDLVTLFDAYFHFSFVGYHVRSDDHRDGLAFGGRQEGGLWNDDGVVDGLRHGADFDGDAGA